MAFVKVALLIAGEVNVLLVNVSEVMRQTIVSVVSGKVKMRIELVLGGIIEYVPLFVVSILMKGPVPRQLC